ncbi:MAG: cell wall hydrolase [Fastidiosipilaceae bacterium]|nr:cell wall hydrolase [Clostridiaceae bacterium]
MSYSNNDDWLQKEIERINGKRSSKITKKKKRVFNHRVANTVVSALLATSIIGLGVELSAFSEKTVYASVLKQEVVPEGIEVFKENTIDAVEDIVPVEIIAEMEEETPPVIAATEPQPDLVITMPRTAPSTVSSTVTETNVEKTEETTSETTTASEQATVESETEETESTKETSMAVKETTSTLVSELTETEVIDDETEEMTEAEEETEKEETDKVEISESITETELTRETSPTELLEVVKTKATEDKTEVSETDPIEKDTSTEAEDGASESETDVKETTSTVAIATTTATSQNSEETEDKVETQITVSTGVAEPDEAIEAAREAERIAAELAAEEAAKNEAAKEAAEREKLIESISPETMDLYLGMMAAECGANWDYEGCLRIAQVINNRVKYGYWGSDLYSVLSAPNQFTPYATGAWRTAPRTEAQRQAALDALEGKTIFGEDVIYFCTDASYARSGWFQSLDHRDTYANTLFFAP